MFGKPAWFRLSERRLGIAPASFGGWAYFAGWAAVLLLPAFALISSGRLPETMIWLFAAGMLGYWDVRQLRGQLTANDDLFVIDEETDISQLSTREFDMRLRGRA